MINKKNKFIVIIFIVHNWCVVEFVFCWPERRIHSLAKIHHLFTPNQFRWFKLLAYADICGGFDSCASSQSRKWPKLWNPSNTLCDVWLPSRRLVVLTGAVSLDLIADSLLQVGSCKLVCWSCKNCAKSVALEMLSPYTWSMASQSERDGLWIGWWLRIAKDWLHWLFDMTFSPWLARIEIHT